LYLKKRKTEKQGMRGQVWSKTLSAKKNYWFRGTARKFKRTDGKKL